MGFLCFGRPSEGDGPADFMPAPRRITKSEIPHDGPNLEKIDIEHSDSPPTYVSVELKASANHVLEVLVESQRCGDLDDVASRHQIIIVDDNFRSHESIRKTIRLTTHLLQLCHTSMEAKSTTFFMGYRNSENDASMEANEKAVLDHLEDLYKSTSRQEAGKIIQEVRGPTVLSHDFRVKAVAQKFEDLKTLARQNVEIAHGEFLSFVRSEKAEFHTGWRTSDIVGQRFDTLFEEACTNARRQDASLNSLRFSLERVLNDIKLQRDNKTFRPTNIIFVCGSKLEKSEVTKLRQVIDETTAGMNGDEKSEVSVQAYACWHGNKSSIKGHQDLDNHKKGNEDIYDCTDISSELLKGGPGKHFFAKAHNGHRKEWDEKKIAMNDIVDFSRAAAFGQENIKGSFLVPNVSEVHFV